jgi:hypothetical protein
MMPYAVDTMRHDTEGSRHDTDRRLPVVEAAALLGVTPDAVRARLRRGTLRKEQGPNGETLVVVEGTVGDQSGDTTGTVADTTPLVERMAGEIEYLKETVARRDEESAELRRIIAGLVQRVPELEPASNGSGEPREGPRTASEEVPDTPAPSGFWRRFFGLN